MKKSEFQNKWYYRLLKIIFYFLYIISLLMTIWSIFVIIYDWFLWFDTIEIWYWENLVYWFLLLPTIILFFELLRTIFFYIVLWEWSFRLIWLIKNKE